MHSVVVSHFTVHSPATSLSNFVVLQQLDKVMDLPTACGLTAVAINHDNTRAVTAGKDGSLTLWNIDVRYRVSVCMCLA